MRLRTFGLTLLLLGAVPSEAFLAAQTGAPRPALPMNMVGAETLESLMLLWEDTYRRTVDPTFRLNFESTMSGHAIQAFITGKTVLAAVTRDMQEEEVKAFTDKWGYAPTRIAVGMDALVILVNKYNPVKEIRTEQLDALWTLSRLQGWPKDVRTWGDLGVTAPNLMDRPIRLVAHPEGSGARDYFRHMIEMDGKPKPNIERGADIMTMVNLIISDQAIKAHAI
jgi:phosphate transport system substrate-binding protein